MGKTSLKIVNDDEQSFLFFFSKTQVHAAKWKWRNNLWVKMKKKKQNYLWLKLRVLARSSCLPLSALMLRPMLHRQTGKQRFTQLTWRSFQEDRWEPSACQRHRRWFGYNRLSSLGAFPPFVKKTKCGVHRLGGANYNSQRNISGHMHCQEKSS